MHTKETRLAVKLKKGDTAALKETIDRYTGYVRTVIRNFSRGAFSEQDIDELCADVFFALWQHREALDESVGFRSYLSASARNAVKDRFKSAKPPCEDISELELPSGFSVEDTALLNETLRCLDEGLSTLSAEESEVFARYYFYGESTPEIARKMNVSEGTVRSRLSRTRSKLKEYLTERGFDHA
ncbi:MAG: sigma-70 family RNA polymerase sigma factor [Lachnospiraceae bacterium]|nr:sigma-70 family RNA polymerase sigma factor [Ruminococcus sp.]MCM1276104.1 sigma-70 family RNA polymerase sigma factor [Lachnospiraceae bacterium]